MIPRMREPTSTTLGFERLRHSHPQSGFSTVARNLSEAAVSTIPCLPLDSSFRCDRQAKTVTQLAATLVDKNSSNHVGCTLKNQNYTTATARPTATIANNSNCAATTAAATPTAATSVATATPRLLLLLMMMMTLCFLLLL